MVGSATLAAVVLTALFAAAGGTPGPDRLSVSNPAGGKLAGGGGPDRLLGGPGPDELLGEQGHDTRAVRAATTS
jgi:hypothetical protein